MKNMDVAPVGKGGKVIETGFAPVVRDQVKQKGVAPGGKRG